MNICVTFAGFACCNLNLLWKNNRRSKQNAERSCQKLQMLPAELYQWQTRHPGNRIAGTISFAGALMHRFIRYWPVTLNIITAQCINAKCPEIRYDVSGIIFRGYPANSTGKIWRRRRRCRLPSFNVGVTMLTVINACRRRLEGFNISFI